MQEQRDAAGYHQPFERDRQITLLAKMVTQPRQRYDRQQITQAERRQYPMIKPHARRGGQDHPGYQPVKRQENNEAASTPHIICPFKICTRRSAPLRRAMMAKLSAKADSSTPK